MSSFRVLVHGLYQVDAVLSGLRVNGSITSNCSTIMIMKIHHYISYQNNNYKYKSVQAFFPFSRYFASLS